MERFDPIKNREAFALLEQKLRNTSLSTSRKHNSDTPSSDGGSTSQPPSNSPNTTALFAAPVSPTAPTMSQNKQSSRVGSSGTSMNSNAPNTESSHAITINSQ